MRSRKDSKSIWHTLHLIIQGGSKLLLAFSCIALAILVLAITYDVVLRSFFGLAVSGVSEYVSEWLMPATILFALSYTERHNEHIRVTLIEDAISRAPQKVLRILSQLLVLVVSMVLAWSSIQLAMGSFDIRETVPMGTEYLAVWPIKIAVSFGWLWLVAQTFSKLIITISQPSITLKAPNADPQGVDVRG